MSIPFENIKPGKIYKYTEDFGVETLLRVRKVETTEDKIRLSVRKITSTEKKLTKSVYAIVLNRKGFNYGNPQFYEQLW